MSSKSGNRMKRPIDRHEALARKRDFEFHKNEECKARVKYYNDFERVNTHFQSWTAPEYYKQFADRLKSSEIEKKKEKKILERRERLRKMLDAENFSLQEELRIIQNGNKSCNKHKKQLSEDVMCEIYKQLKIDSDNKRRKEIEDNLYQQWRKTKGCILLEAPEFNEHQALAKMSWLDKQVAKQLDKEKKVKSEIITKKVQIEQIKNEIVLLVNQERDMKTDYDKLKLQIEHDIKEYQDIEKKYEYITSNESNLKEYSNKVDQIYCNYLKKHENEILQREFLVGDDKFCRIHLKQYNEIVIDYLDYKIDIINNLKQICSETFQIVLDSTLSVLLKQYKIEIKRKHQICIIYDSEAKRVWIDFAKKWKYEENNQHELMIEILIMIKKDADNKIQSNLKGQKKYIDDKEKLLKSLEDSNYKINVLEKDIETIKNQIETLKKNVINEESKHNMLNEYLTEFDKSENVLQKLDKPLKTSSIDYKQAKKSSSRYHDSIKDIIYNTFQPDCYS